MPKKANNEIETSAAIDSEIKTIPFFDPALISMKEVNTYCPIPKSLIDNNITKEKNIDHSTNSGVSK